MAQSLADSVEFVEGGAEHRLLLIADHASNRIPSGIDLGISDALLGDHIAVDIGAGPLTRALACRLDCPAIMGAWSRLVVDLNRECDEPNVIPATSDGWPIPGNEGLKAAVRQTRIERYWKPYHAFIEARMKDSRPAMLVGIHSFTPQLASRPDYRRPWQIGILYNADVRAARIAIPLLREAGLVTGDNEPYSGQQLNATMNRHAEAHGLPYLGIEVRQDLIADETAAGEWAELLAPVIMRVVATLACSSPIDH
jgi:predicted N-formylglutamate amidohydrolase